MLKAVYIFICLVALAIGLTACGTVADLKGDVCLSNKDTSNYYHNYRITGNQATISEYTYKPSERVGWVSSLAGRKCEGRPILEVLDFAPDGENATIAIVRLGS